MKAGAAILVGASAVAEFAEPLINQLESGSNKSNDKNNQTNPKNTQTTISQSPSTQTITSLPVNKKNKN